MAITNGMAPLSGDRRGDDVVLSNVLAFDIKVYDPEAPYAPLHLINTNVVLVNARESENKGRGVDTFLRSPLHCGSSATGWRDTAQFMAGSVSRASAMAASGAASTSPPCSASPRCRTCMPCAPRCCTLQTG